MYDYIILYIDYNLTSIDICHGWLTSRTLMIVNQIIWTDFNSTFTFNLFAVTTVHHLLLGSSIPQPTYNEMNMKQNEMV